MVTTVPEMVVTVVGSPVCELFGRVVGVIRGWPEIVVGLVVGAVTGGRRVPVGSLVVTKGGSLVKAVVGWMGG
jgi:hypothetical protein